MPNENNFERIAGAVSAQMALNAETEATSKEPLLNEESPTNIETEKERKMFQQQIERLHEFLTLASSFKTRDEVEAAISSTEEVWRSDMRAASKYLYEHPQEWAEFLTNDIRIYHTPEEDITIGAILISENSDVSIEQRKVSFGILRTAVEQLSAEHPGRALATEYFENERNSLDRLHNEEIYKEAKALLNQDLLGSLELLGQLKEGVRVYGSESWEVGRAIADISVEHAKELKMQFQAMAPEVRKQRYRTLLEISNLPSLTVNRFSEIIFELGKEELYRTLLKKDVVYLTDKFGKDAREILGTQELLRSLVDYAPNQALFNANRLFGDVPPREIIKLVRKKFNPDNATELLRIIEATWGQEILFEILLEPETLEHIPPSNQLEFLKEYPDVEGKIPWAGALKRMEKMQARTARREYDPWLTAINPLADTLQREGIISFANPEHAEQFAAYTEEFGAVNAPTLFHAFLELRTAENIHEVSSKVREEVRAIIGRTFERLNDPEAVLNVLRQKRQELVKGLLADEIPEGLDSVIGIELFRSARGATRWERGTNERALIETWRETKETKPDAARLPEGYREHSFVVAERVRDTGDRVARQEQAKRDILESGEVKKRLRVQQEAFHDGRRPLPEIIGINRDRILNEIDAQIQKTRQRLETLSENARGPAEKNLGRLEEQRKRIVDSGKEKAVSEIVGDEYVRLIETVASLGMKSSAIDAFARVVSAAHMRKIAPEQFVRSMDRIGGTGDTVTPELIQESRDILVDYIKEHYLHPKQEEHQTNHAPFSSEARKLLERSWQLLEGVKGHPLVRAHDSLQALAQGKLSTKTVEITMMPVQGILRIMSGDIGDACYTSKHQQLAKGEVPDLHGIMFVLGRNTAEERFGGSALFIETESEVGGEKILLVRANNPRENLLQSIDSDRMVQETIDEAIRIAERRGLDRVVVPLDQTSQSSSNRDEVSKYYENHFSSGEKVGLADEPETNFNGYNVWNKDGIHAVVTVWKREKKS